MDKFVHYHLENHMQFYNVNYTLYLHPVYRRSHFQDSCSTNADCTPCDANAEIIEETANAEDEQNQIQFNTVIDDPIYIDFVKSCLTDDFQFTNNLFDGNNNLILFSHF